LQVSRKGISLHQRMRTQRKRRVPKPISSLMGESDLVGDSVSQQTLSDILAIGNERLRTDETSTGAGHNVSH
jgi:hypothetical protein